VRQLLISFLAFFILTLLLPPLLSASAAQAQTGYWVQVEAHATLRTAEDFAARYEARVGSVAGFRIAGGWYALALGPYETAADAEAVRQRLLAARELRGDAYVTDGTIYGEQFWPAGAALRETAQPPAAVAPEPVVAPAPEPVVEAPPQPAPQVAVVEPAPPPTPAPEPEETLAEARAADGRLTRDERAEIQTALQFFGFYTQRIDAAFGPGTRSAIQAWQRENGLEPTGFLTSRQRSALVGGRAAALARFDYQTVRDEQAGVEIMLPLGMVAFDRHEAPFAHFREINGSGMRVLLISQEGTQATLFGLYEIMQTLTVIPTEGARERRANGFLLTGRNETARAHAEARFERGQIKGFVLLWEARADADAAPVLAAMQSSFRAIAGVLPDSAGSAGSSVARRDLVAGLEVRRPVRARSGFFVDAVGSVVTAAEAVAGCDRVTIDEAYTAQVRLIDEALGIAVLSPSEPLVPLAFAQFAPQAPGLGVAVRLSGFSFQDTLNRPILTDGRLSDLRGLNGEAEFRTLTVAAREGDAGGPVFDGNGAVIGMLLPELRVAGRTLPNDVRFALGSETILAALERARLRGALSRENVAMPPEILTRVSGDLTVLVSCWN
jgi:peptidoglycan hydrolase-like protein with peptidoglycan-binding domain